MTKHPRLGVRQRLPAARDPQMRDKAKHKAEPDTQWDKSEKAKEARIATVEPVFGDLRHNKRLAGFTLRRRESVDGQ